jgi:hypothetical protein
MNRWTVDYYCYHSCLQVNAAAAAAAAAGDAALRPSARRVLAHFVVRYTGHWRALYSSAELCFPRRRLS